MRAFRTFDLAVQFYRVIETLKIQGILKEQLRRAASSIALNLAEGRGKKTTLDQKRFFQIALGSLRECEAILILADLKNTSTWKMLDILGAHLYLLIKRAK